MEKNMECETIMKLYGIGKFYWKSIKSLNYDNLC